MGNVLDLMLSRLPDSYKKGPDSNNYRLLSVTTQHIQENEETLHAIEEWRDIDAAAGTTLDLHGTNVQQARGLASDEVFRVLIKSRIKRNLSDGSIDTLIDFISFLLRVDPSQIHITELWETENKPAVLHIDAPAGPVSATGLSLKQFGTLINLVTACGVRAEVLFEGTFAFSSVYDRSEVSPDGFADDAGTTGGTLGWAFDPATDTDLPF